MSWRPQRDSNPRRRLEGPMSYPLDDGARSNGLERRSRRGRSLLQVREWAPTAGFEPATSSFARKCSLRTELRRSVRGVDPGQGFEPCLRGSEPRVLPLTPPWKEWARWSGREDSNLRLPPSKGGTLTRLRYAPFEPVWVVPPVGIEPTRCRLRVGCSTAELRRRVLVLAAGVAPASPGSKPGVLSVERRQPCDAGVLTGSRTQGLEVHSLPLYR